MQISSDVSGDQPTHLIRTSSARERRVHPALFRGATLCCWTWSGTTPGWPTWPSPPSGSPGLRCPGSAWTLRAVPSLTGARDAGQMHWLVAFIVHLSMLKKLYGYVFESLCLVSRSNRSFFLASNEQVWVSNLHSRHVSNRSEATVYCCDRLLASACLFLGKYDLKWKFYERLDNGDEKELACFLFTIKIIWNHRTGDSNLIILNIP